MNPLNNCLKRGKIWTLLSQPGLASYGLSARSPTAGDWCEQFLAAPHGDKIKSLCHDPTKKSVARTMGSKTLWSTSEVWASLQTRMFAAFKNLPAFYSTDVIFLEGNGT